MRPFSDAKVLLLSLSIERVAVMKPLSGWKEIAGHLHQAVRTVQRWENSGLPIHRVKAGPSPVFAFKEELDAWRQATPMRCSEAIAQLSARVESLESKLSELERPVKQRKRRNQPRSN